MLKLRDPIITGPPTQEGTDLPSLREPESLEMPTPYVAYAGARRMNSKELADPRSAAVPPAPGFDRFGERVSHITDRFVLSGSAEAYRIWRFQSAAPAIEFPVTEEGWALAWKKFRELENQTA